MVFAIFRRPAIELWSNAGLIQTIPLDPEVCVVPSFDPSGCCREPLALLITSEGVALLDLESGQQHPRRPPLPPGAIEHSTWIGFDETRRRLLLWPDARTLLLGSTTTDEWRACHMPEHRRMRDWAFAGERARAFVLDDAGDLWLGEFFATAQRGWELGSARGSSSSASLAALAKLRHAVEQQPHAPEPALVYADALLARGDPRGELIMLQHHGARAEADALLARCDLALTGGLGRLSSAIIELDWQRGFVRKARFVLDEIEQIHVVFAFLGNESARLLESLDLSFTPAAKQAATFDESEIRTYLAAARHLPRLSGLDIGRKHYGLDAEA
jgi:uncharacterized protein (TIGR02996 family)